MKNWQDVIDRSKSPGEKNIYCLDDNKSMVDKKKKVLAERKYALAKKNYYIKEGCKQIYFTQREAECSYYLLRGLTISATATMLELSPRTVEFYVKNMRTKMGAKNKSDLVERLHNLNFLQKLVAEGMT